MIYGERKKRILLDVLQGNSLSYYRFKRKQLYVAVSLHSIIHRNGESKWEVVGKIKYEWVVICSPNWIRWLFFLVWMTFFDAWLAYSHVWMYLA
jgi:hypothetical protein